MTRQNARRNARVNVSLIAAIAALSAGAAMASEAITTAAKLPEATAAAPPVSSSATPADLTTAQQIDAYLANPPSLGSQDEEIDGVVGGGERDRAPRGMVEVAVGSHGYRSAYMQTEIPIGKTGSVSIAISQGRNEPYGYGYGYGYGRGLGLGMGSHLGSYDCGTPLTSICSPFDNRRVR